MRTPAPSRYLLALGLAGEGASAAGLGFLGVLLGTGVLEIQLALRLHRLR